MSENIIQGMFVKLGYQFDESQLKKFDQFVVGTRKFLKRAALAAIALAASIAALSKSYANQAISTDRVAKSTGNSTKELEAFLRVSDKVTGSREQGLAINEKIFRQQQNLQTGLALDEGFLRGLNDLGLSYDILNQGTPVETFQKINEAMQGLDKTTQLNIASLLGMNNNFELLTRAGLRQDIIGEKTNKNFEALRKADEIVKSLKNDFEDFVTSFTLDGQKDPFFLTALEWLRDTGIPIVKDFFSLVGGGFRVVSGVIIEIGKQVKELISAFSVVGDNKFFNQIASAVLGSIKILDVVGNFAGTGAAKLLGAGTSNTSTNNNTTNLNNRVNINGVSDTEAVGRRVDDSLQNMIDQIPTGLAN